MSLADFMAVYPTTVVGIFQSGPAGAASMAKNNSFMANCVLQLFLGQGQTSLMLS